MRSLEWIGLRARWVLALGALLALFLQDLATFLRPALPVFVALMYFLAMVRVDLPAIFHRLLNLQRMMIAMGTCIALMIGLPILVAILSKILGLSTEINASMIYISAAPPLGSAAALCLLLGLDAALALELTIIGSFLAPVLGPLVTSFLLGNAVEVDPIDMSLRLALMIGAGAILALIIRPLIGPKVINENASIFDGIGAVAMIATILPIFAGVTGYITDTPLLAICVLCLVFVLNIGMQIIATPLLRKITHNESAGAVGLICGNRNAALFMAALPQSPVFTLFVALYQFPMYMTPLLLKRFYRRAA